jgi:hypothetical protein
VIRRSTFAVAWSGALSAIHWQVTWGAIGFAVASPRYPAPGWIQAGQHADGARRRLPRRHVDEAEQVFRSSLAAIERYGIAEGVRQHGGLCSAIGPGAGPARAAAGTGDRLRQRQQARRWTASLGQPGIIALRWGWTAPNGISSGGAMTRTSMDRYASGPWRWRPAGAAWSGARDGIGGPPARFAPRRGWAVSSSCCPRPDVVRHPISDWRRSPTPVRVAARRTRLAEQRRARTLPQLRAAYLRGTTPPHTTTRGSRPAALPAAAQGWRWSVPRRSRRTGDHRMLLTAGR